MTSKITALITGINGQDGSLLAQELVTAGYEVHGTFRRGSANYLWRLEEMQILDKLNLYEYTFGGNSRELRRILEQKFDYIYHLAGDSFTHDSLYHPFRTINTNLSGCIELLENSVEICPSSHIFMACSSEIFGRGSNHNFFVSEESLRKPTNPYGISHSAILDLSRFFREMYSAFISVGILFNHESEYRSPQFLTRKITKGLAGLKFGATGKDPLQLGNLNTSRDWGSAKEYVSYFSKILQLSEADDFVIATGKPTSVKQIIMWACEVFGYEPEFHGEGSNEICFDNKTGNILIRSTKKFYREIETPCVLGSTNKLIQKISVKPVHDIRTVIQEMCVKDLKRLKN